MERTGIEPVSVRSVKKSDFQRGKCMTIRSDRVRAIHAWYERRVAEGQVHHWREFSRTGTAPGMEFTGTRINEMNGTRLAELQCLGEKPLVRLVQPNILTYSRHVLIRDTLRSLGAQVLAVPSGLLDVADIMRPSIEVIHSERSFDPIRAEQQLIRADVQHRQRDKWGGYGYRWMTRSAYFLSGHDQNERGLSYFFCELPPGVEPKTVAEAYETLKPESVKIAEKLKRKVKRQGDMFFIRDRGFRPNEEDIVQKGFLHGSNHRAWQLATVDGLTYARGPITHAPSGRRPDHKPLRLGRRHWWLCVRNTVPVTG